jgi:BlaI family transcriptional regulator, penicillinase repressor
MGDANPPASDAELDVLKVLWSHGAGTVHEVAARLHKMKRRWAYNTVLTLLSRLRDKGYVSSEKSGASLVFTAMLSREDVLRGRLNALADQVCDGAPVPLVNALVQGQRFSSEEIAHFRRLLDELESQE